MPEIVKYLSFSGAGAQPAVTEI